MRCEFSLSNKIIGAVAISDNLSAYVTSIPEEAIQKIKKKAKQAGGAIIRAEYYLGNERVGERLFDPPAS